MDYMSVQELAALKGCSLQYVQRLIKDGKLSATLDSNSTTKVKQYRIAVSALPADLQRKYYAKVKQAVAVQAPNTPRGNASLEKYSEAERADIAWWSVLIEEWQRFRASHPDKNWTELDAHFIQTKGYEGITLSYSSLRRHQLALENGDFDALIEKRGKWRKGQSSVPDEFFEVFKAYYLGQTKRKIPRAYELTVLWCEDNAPDLLKPPPSYDAVYRKLQTLPRYVIDYHREGITHFENHYCPYIERDYETLRANEIWIADNHKLDIYSRATVDSPPRRLTLGALIDCLSGVYTGIHLTEHPNSNSTVLTIYRGYKEGFGIPENYYTDNGREYLTHDISGMGHRSRKNKEAIETPLTIFQLLGIQMTNAIPANAKAKKIERDFGDFAAYISKLFPTYCGKDPVNKPEQLAEMVAKGEIPLDSDVIYKIETLIYGYLNLRPYGGSLAKHRGKTRLEVYNESISQNTMRTATDENLRLLLMRHSRTQTINKMGVHVPLYGKKLRYWDDEFLLMQGQKVYLRYDPADMSIVHVYDLEQRWLRAVPMEEECRQTYGADNESIKASMAKTKRAARLMKEAAESAITVEVEDPLDLMVRKALKNLETAKPSAAKTVVLISPDQKSIPKIPDNYDFPMVDINHERMNRNLESRLKGVV